MSRSYKKTAGWTDFTCKKDKRQSNKVVRQYKGEIDNGKSYKKLYETWNIRDWKQLYHSKESVENATNYLGEKTDTPIYKYYMK